MIEVALENDQFFGNISDDDIDALIDEFGLSDKELDQILDSDGFGDIMDRLGESDLEFDDFAPDGGDFDFGSLEKVLKEIDSEFADFEDLDLLEIIPEFEVLPVKSVSTKPTLDVKVEVLKNSDKAEAEKNVDA